MLLVLLLAPCALGAQTLEIAPYVGYRFGGDLYEEFTERPLDIDGAPSVGALVDVFLDASTSLSFLYSHQEARLDLDAVQGGSGEAALAIDHWHVGGTELLGSGAARPFLTGSLGLTRFGTDRDHEVRFSLAAGGGVKLRPSRHVGARFDGRVYAVFADGDTVGGICTPGGCLVGLDVSVLWQAEFTAALVLSF